VLYHLLESLLPGNYGYQNPLFRALLAILLAFLLVLLLGPRFIRLLVSKKMCDIPDFDHKTLNELTADKSNVPTGGGLLMMPAIAVSVLLLANLTVLYIYLAFFCLIWLSALGYWDDRIKLRDKRATGSRDGLKFYQKLLFQIGLGVMLGIAIYQRGELTFFAVEDVDKQDFRILAIPFFKGETAASFGVLLPAWAFYVITVIVVAGTSNAVNLTDGMDGLASGCVALCAAVFMLLAWAVGDERIAEYLLIPYIPQSGELAVLCGAMVGSCLGFLWYNCHPAMVFMGDTGSLPLGGLIGLVAIVIRQELMLFIVGGVFVIEALSVMLQVGFYKGTGGRRIFRCAPIHHHFHLGGWSETQVVTRFWLLSVLFAALALATMKLR
jgi:phospho-N-acetylmuramoyl-pentapeptide-transferase